ncbi:hypothetical protein [Isoptericola aurantiacus]|uniref:hypothetical protein n=1 Tax=Isoptericola aurantiacus TaxID=3377839 RepID=UPI00383B1E96
MTTSEPGTRTDVLIGRLARAKLLAALDDAGVQLNVHARTLLDDVDLDEAAGRRLTLTEVSAAELGLGGGASLSEVFAAATQRGLGLCPAATAPYLSLGMDRLGSLHRPGAVRPSRSSTRWTDTWTLGTRAWAAARRTGGGGGQTPTDAGPARGEA